MPWVPEEGMDPRLLNALTRGGRPMDTSIPVREPDGTAVPVGQSAGEPISQGAANTIPQGHWQEAPDEPGIAESLVHGGLQGITLGHEDEAGGALQAAIDKLTGAHENFVALYQKHRDEIRERQRLAAEAHPIAYHGAELAGGLALPFPGGEAATLGRMAATGAAYGAVSGLGHSDAQSADELAKAGLLGAAGGAGAGALGYGVGKAITSEPVTAALDKAGIHMGRAHLQGSMGRMVGQATKPISEDAVRAAEAAGAFGGKNIAQSVDVLDNAQSVAGDAVKQQVQDLTERGVRSTNLRALAQHWSDQADIIESKTMGSPVAALMRKRAQELLSKLPEYAEVRDPQELAALEQFAKDQTAWQQKYDSVMARLGGSSKSVGQRVRPDGSVELYQIADNPRIRQMAENEAGPRPVPPQMTHGPTYMPESTVPLSRGEQLKSSLQDRGNRSLIDPSAATEADWQMGMDLRLGNEQSIGQQAGPDALGQYQNAKQGFGNIEEARAAAEKGAARYQNRPLVGLPEMLMLAHGNIPGAVGMHLLKTRGYSAATSGLMGTAKMLTSVATTAPRALGRYASVIQRAAQQGPDAVAQKHFVLQATDPQYRQMLARIRAEQGNEDGGE